MRIKPLCVKNQDCKGRNNNWKEKEGNVYFVRAPNEFRKLTNKKRAPSL